MLTEISENIPQEGVKAIIPKFIWTLYSQNICH